LPKGLRVRIPLSAQALAGGRARLGT